MRWRRIKDADSADEVAPDSDNSTARSSPAVEQVAEPTGEPTLRPRVEAHTSPGRPATPLGVELREDYGLAENTPWPRGRPSYLDEPPWAAQPTPRRTNHYAR